MAKDSKGNIVCDCGVCTACIGEKPDHVREIDRLRAELSRYTRLSECGRTLGDDLDNVELIMSLRAELVDAQGDALDWAARCGETQAQLEKVTDELFDLRAELASRPTAITCAGKHGHITVITDCPECVKEELAKAQEENERLLTFISQACDNDLIVCANNLRYEAENRAEAAEAKVKELKAENMELTNGPRCGDCGDTGLLNNRVEGDYYCTCITETEAYEKIEARNQELNTIIEASWAKAFEDTREIERLKLALSEAHIKGMEEAVRILMHQTWTMAEENCFIDRDNSIDDIRIRIAELKELPK